jgi:acetyl esterase
MPLDPQTTAFLKTLDTSAPLTALTIPDARAATRLRNLADTEPVPLHSVCDLTLGAIGARLYRPVPEPAQPVLIYFHGGGWTLCDLDTHDATCRRLALASGAAVLSVDYRLAPEHRFPAAVDDAIDAVRWVARNGVQLGLDPARIAVSGDSAGANLAAVACLIARDSGGPPIRAQVLIVPVTDAVSSRPSYVENAEGYYLTRDAMTWFFHHYINGQTPDWRVFPLQAPSLASLPPALVLTAEFDPLRDEGEEYAARLAREGTPVELTRYSGTIHQFVVLAGQIDAGRQAIRQIGDFLRRNL